jgi:hypothetical protein
VHGQLVLRHSDSIVHSELPCRVLWRRNIKGLHVMLTCLCNLRYQQLHLHLLQASERRGLLPVQEHMCDQMPLQRLLLKRGQLNLRCMLPSVHDVHRGHR